MGDVGSDGRMPNVREWRDAGGKHRRTWRSAGSDRCHARCGIGIRFGKTLPIASLAEARELHDARRVFRTRSIAHQIEAAELEAAETFERIAPPCAVVDFLAHRFAEFAIADDVYPDITLLLDDVGY